MIWPDIGSWSGTANVSLPTSLADQTQYGTLRYFPTQQHKALNQSKFCYSLPATAGSYYLIRASFWMGSKELYDTLVSGQIRFRVIVDTYEGVEVVINFPQSNPWFEEMYIPTQSGKTSVSVCLSAASDSSDRSISGMPPRRATLRSSRTKAAMTATPIAITSQTHAAQPRS